MGAQASREADGGGGGDGPGPPMRLSPRTWQEGRPFTLLHDEAFVADRYHELRGAANGEQSLKSGASSTNEADDLQQVADLARIQLFSQPVRDASSAKMNAADASNAASDTNAAPERSAASNALAAMAANLLARGNPATTASELQRTKLVAIVEDYYAQLADQLNQDIKARRRSAVAKTPDVSTEGSPQRKVIRGGSSASVFSVGSFRVQLEMLREFRSTIPMLFENGVLAIVRSLLDFPPFALQDIAAQSPEEALVTDLHQFCRRILQDDTSALTQSHQEVLLLLLLAFGVSTGRISLLLDFVDGIVHGKFDTSSCLQGDSFSVWVERFVKRLESYHIDFSLGRFDEETLVKKFQLKTIIPDADPDSNEKTTHNCTSIATDGTFLYIWSAQSGLQKVGTGANFTVPGRIYAEKSAEIYARALIQPRNYRYALFGSGINVLDIIQSEVTGLAAGDKASRKVRNVIQAGQSCNMQWMAASPQKLFVSFVGDGIDSMYILNDDDDLQIPETLEECNSVIVTSAFYGRFDMASDEGLNTLSTLATKALVDDERAHKLLFSQDLLQILLPNANKAHITEDSRLALFHAEAGKNNLVHERFQFGDDLLQRNTQYISSSLAFCGDSLYLASSVHGQDTTEPRSIRQASLLAIRIDSHNLDALEIVEVPDEPSDNSASISATSYPLFTIGSEGKYLYCIRMTGETVRVNIFQPKTDLSNTRKLLYVRSIDLNNRDIHSTTFVNCFLNIMKMELVGSKKLDFAIPAIYTNGAVIALVLPCSDGSPISYHGAFFDCEDGKFLGGGCHTVGDKARGSASGTSNYFERTIMGSSYCFDAKNNLIWAFDHVKGSLASYQNPGKKISLIDTSIDKLLRDIRSSTSNDDTTISTLSKPMSSMRSVALRILCFLLKNAESSDIDELSKSPDDSSDMMIVPFVSDLNFIGFQVLLTLISEYSTSFSNIDTCPALVPCLRASLGILNTNTLLLLRSRGSHENVINLMREELSAPLNTLIHSSNDLMEELQQRTEITEWKMQVKSLALDLYTTSMPIFYSGVNEQLNCALGYLERWTNSHVNSTELTILARLLSHLCLEASLIQECVIEFEVTFGLYQQLVNYAVTLQKTRFHNLSSDFSSSDDDPFMQLVCLINCISQSIMVSVRSSTGHVLMKSLGRAFSAISLIIDGIVDICMSVLSNVKANSDRMVSMSVEHLMKIGFVGSLCPMIISSSLVFVKCRNDVFLSRLMSDEQSNEATDILSKKVFDFFKETTTKLSSLLECMDKMGQLIDPANRLTEVENISVVNRTEIMESTHEYENNMDSLVELRIPGASRIVVVFDSRCRTEFNYDYVTFFKNEDRVERYGEQYYSGRDADHNWPGVGSNPPLVIESDHCFVHFHSDSSNTDWGFKFCATGEILQKKTFSQLHWIPFMSESIAQLLDEHIKVLMDGDSFAPVEEIEVQNSKYLQSDLLKNGICSKEEQNTSVVCLLQDFANPTENSQAAHVINALLNRSGAFRQRTVSRSSSFTATAESSSNKQINNAVGAVAAAIFHHNVLGMDAYAFAQNLRGDISDHLLRGWNNAQKMRDWFHLGDAADASIHRAISPSRRRSRKLHRQPSAFKGVSEESLQILCTNVIERAKFLLELTPASFSYVSGAKRRWGLLAKYGHAIGKMSNNESPLDKWYNLLDELQAATELRSLFQYRRKSSERMRNTQNKSVTEQVLAFIQSDCDVKELRRVIATRNLRAESRTIGMRVFADTWQRSSNQQLKSVLVETFLSTMKAFSTPLIHDILEPGKSGALNSTRIHFDINISGCEDELRKQLNQSFGSCLIVLSKELSFVLPTDTSSSALISGILKVFAIDFELDDSYLLHESRILTQIIRLLSWEAVGVRRAAQCVLSVLLSHFVIDQVDTRAEDNDTMDESDGVDACAFQRQLLAVVGLQLEGITSFVKTPMQVNTDFDDQSQIQSRMYYLPENSPGWTTPHDRKSSIRWNHSIMLWIYVSSNSCVYTLKIGDEVRRGPDWKDDNDEQITETDIGIVSSIHDSSTVQVRWILTNSASQCTFDPKRNIYDVIPVDQGVGGVIFTKGNANLVKDTVFACPWSHMALFMSDKRELNYKIASGSEHEYIYSTSYELEVDEWSHVAIVQEEEVLKFFVNGTMVNQHLLSPFLLMQGNLDPGESKIIESSHPYADSTDQYWPVHIPGATKIRITFDPLSDIDSTTGFVRIYKDASCSEHWGDDKYTGKYHDPERNFPGAQSHRGRRRKYLEPDNTVENESIYVLSDRFVVNFHSEGSSSGWGFRLLASPEFPSDMYAGCDDLPHMKPSLNPYPLYFGQAPARVLDDQAAKCWIYQPKILNFSISESDVVAEIQSTAPSSEYAPVRVSNDRILHILGLVRTCSESAFGRQMISTAENLRNLLFLAVDDRVSIEVRCGSINVLRDLATSVTPDIINTQFAQVVPSSKLNFTETIFSRLADLLNIWQNYEKSCEGKCLDVETEDCNETLDEELLELRSSAQGVTSLISAYVSLLRKLSLISDWNESMFEIISTSLKSCTNTHSLNELGRVMASLALFGGSYDGIYVGGRVKCCVNIDGKEAIETGYLTQYVLKLGVRLARVVFDCDTTRPVDVPINDIARENDEQIAELAQFVQQMAPYINEIMALFEQLLRVTINVNHEESKAKPKIVKKEHVEILESEHPYTNDMDATYPLEFHGATEIFIYFDSASCTADCNDFVQFRKRPGSGDASDLTGEYWGDEKYFGDSFPGVGDKQPLRIPASSVDVYFHSDSSTTDPNNNWGFRLRAYAFDQVLTYPPEIPPPAIVNAINDIHARCVKSIDRILHLKSSHVLESLFNSLLPVLSGIAIRPSDGRPSQSAPKSQVFESKHPYANSVHEYMTVTFSGASTLRVTFDPQCRTEIGCDYLCFFKDKTLTDRWGQYQYSGVEETANWPGTGGRAPLVIPADSFTMLWCTDATNVEWGWKFTVNAEFPSVIPLSLPLEQLDKRAHQLAEILYERPKHQRQPTLDEFENFDKMESASASLERFLPGDPMWKILTSRYLLNHSEAQNYGQSRRNTFRVVSEAGTNIYSDKSDDASVLCTLEHGEEFSSHTHRAGWVKLEREKSDDEIRKEGWTIHRNEDAFFVRSTSILEHNEDLLVLGIDDSPLEFFQSTLEMDDCNPEHDALVKFTCPFTFEDLKGQNNRLQSLAYDSHRALATKLAQHAVLAFLSRESEYDQLLLNSFGSPDEFLLLISKFFVQERTHKEYDKFSDTWILLGKALRRTFHDQANDAVMHQLLLRCHEIIRNSSELLPKGRGAVRIVESAHPYLDNLDQYWQVSIPGAKKIRVVFDPRSKSESGCDYVCFYKLQTDRSELYGEAQYGGRSGSENWPGFGDREPLTIESDTFEMHFHSDSSQNDWGFKMFAIGIFDDADETEEMERNIDELMKLLSLCCWIFTELSSIQCLSTNSVCYDLLYSDYMIDTLIIGLETCPQRIRLHLLQVMTTIVRDNNFISTLSLVVMGRARDLIKAKLRAQHHTEECIETKSHYIQALTECAVAIDLAIDSCYCLGLSVSSLWNRAIANQPSKVVFQAGDPYYWWHSDVHYPRASIKHRLHLQNFSSTLIVGIVGKDEDVSIDPVLIFSWNSDGFMHVLANHEHEDNGTNSRNILACGDEVTFLLDYEQKSIVLLKNGLPAVVVAGSELVGALVRWEEVFSPQTKSNLVLAVKTTDPNAQVLQQTLLCSSLPLLQLPPEPAWYEKITDATSMLLDYHENRSSNIVMLESTHPFSNSSTMSEPSHVRISGAIALEIRFDKRTKMRENDLIQLTAADHLDEDNSETVTLKGLSGERDSSTFPMVFLADTQKRSDLPRIGDCVTRSKDWEYGDEDGGAGSIGIIKEIVSWQGRTGSALRVQWLSNDAMNTYRFGYDGYFDVQRRIHGNQQLTPLVIEGESLSFRVQIAESKQLNLALNENTDSFFGSLMLTGCEKLMLSLNSIDTFCAKDEFSVEFWICMDSHWVQNSRSSVLEMEIFHIDSSNAFPLISVRVNQDRKPLVYITVVNEDGAMACQAIENKSFAPTETLLIVDDWIHLALVISGKQIVLYQNGVILLAGILPCFNPMVKHIIFGSKIGYEIEASDNCLSLCAHIYDVKLWDVALQIEQVQSHVKGIESVSNGDSRPGTPRSKNTMITSFLLPPSPPHSPRSPSRSFVVPQQLKQWVTSNRTGKDNVIVRSSYALKVSKPTTASLPGKIIYYEAHILTSGKISIGWIPLQAAVEDQEIMLGEDGRAFGVEPNRKKTHFGGVNSDFEFYSELSSPRSPRRSIIGEVFGRDGDVVGCALCTATNELFFYVNGQLVANTEIENIAHNNTNSQISENLSVDEEHMKFDSLVGEMLSMGFSRQLSTEAIEASGAQEVPTAVEWLLERNPTDPVAHATSPRRRLSSVSSTESFGLGSPRNRRQKSLALSGESINDYYVPAASLGSQGAQSIAWNFGHQEFKYAPNDVHLVSAMEAAPTSEHFFEVFEYTGKKWDRVQYRHKIQDITPTMVGWWKLDEGNGTRLEDSSGNEHTGELMTQNNSTLVDKDFETVWDTESTPPLAATRRNRQPIFFNSDGDSAKIRRRKAIGTTWGYKFYVIPHFSTASIGRRRFKPSAARFAECSRGLTSRHDHQLVKYVNKAAQSKQLAASQLLRASWPEFAPNNETLVRWPVLVEIATGRRKDASSEYSDKSNDETTSSLLEIESTDMTAVKPSNDRLANHFKILQDFNGCVHRLLPFVKFRRPGVVSSGRLNGMSLHELVVEQRGRIFSAVKLTIWEDALRRTNETGVSIEVTLSRPKAMRHRATGKPDTTGRYTLFSQAFRQLSGLDGTHFRRQERIYTVTFLGENAQDAGGPYRETFAQYCEELHSTRLPLFLLTSNAQHNVGVGREKWILNPGATSPTLLQMYEFLGKLMGSAVRSKQYLALNLTTLVWKKLVSEHVSIEDLAAVDSMVINSMQKMRTIDQCGVTEEMFEDIVMETFSTLSADNRVVELVPNGASIPVTFANRCEYADLVEQYRLHEYDREIEALVHGMAKVIPAKLLACFTGAELEFMVCGTPEIDIDLLEKCTEYSGCSADQTHVVWFWKVLRSFSHEERSTFLRFVWGRSRLPATEKEFPQLFKLQSFSKQQPGQSVDGYLPIAHTCFFAVEMPPYSSEQVLRAKLMYAIYNCQEIDADGDSVAANQLGWEE